MNDCKWWILIRCWYLCSKVESCRYYRREPNSCLAARLACNSWTWTCHLFVRTKVGDCLRHRAQGFRQSAGSAFLEPFLCHQSLTTKWDEVPHIERNFRQSAIWQCMPTLLFWNVQDCMSPSNRPHSAFVLHTNCDRYSQGVPTQFNGGGGCY